MKRLVRVVMLVSLLLAALPFVGGTQVMAANEANENIDFILHKLAIPSSEMPEKILNDGKNDGKTAELLKDYKGLDGVTFAVYDISEEFYQARAKLREEGLQGTALQEAAQAEMVGLELNNRAPLQTQETATINGEAGQAKFSLPAKSEDKDAIYLFRETKAPAQVEAPAEDLVVVLPIIDNETSGSTMNTIHLFPKNAIVEEQPTFDKQIIDQQSSYQFGDQIDYRLTTRIPISLLNYTMYRVSDQADESLLMLPETLKVTVNQTTLVKDSDYQLKTDDHGFMLDFNIESLKNYTGKTVTISYSMRLNSYEKVDQALLNQADLVTDFDKLADHGEIYTGGKKFLKVDLTDESKQLSGAVFVVQNGQNNYLQKTDTGYQWTKDQVQAMKLQSNDQGEFQVMGLRYGNYFLKELEAPAGYVVSQDPIPFMVTKGASTLALKVVNKPTAKQVVPPTPQIPSTPAAYSPSKIFPKTNMLTNYWLVVVGGVLLVSLAAFYKKNKKE
ncbi:MAG: SpaH/EbpB family LPXTG-anchored major pilin [Enterococcus viikkiensis]